MLMFVVAACADGRDGEALAHQIDDARAHVDELRAEVEDHAAAAETAVDLAALQALEKLHRTDADEHMDMLGHAINDMGMCAGGASGMVDGMMTTHEMCNNEMDRHQQAIAATVDLATARAEEQAHRTAMMNRLDELDGMADTMMGSHGTMMCRGHHGIDAHHD